MTVNVFRSMYRLKTWRGGARVPYGWYCIKPEVKAADQFQMNTTYPKPKGASMKGWTRKWLWLRVPLWDEHTYLYRARTQFTVLINMDKLDPYLLSDGERRVYEHFSADRPPNEAQKRIGAYPRVWLPHYNLIRMETYLAMGNLRNLYT